MKHTVLKMMDKFMALVSDKVLERHIECMAH